MNDLTVYFRGQALALEIDSYASNGATAIRFVEPRTGAPYLMATTNLPESSGLTPFQFFLKDWSENTGVPRALAKHVHRVGLPVASGHVKVSLYEVNADSPLRDLIEAHLKAHLSSDGSSDLGEDEVPEGGTPVSRDEGPGLDVPELVRGLAASGLNVVVLDSEADIADVIATGLATEALAVGLDSAPAEEPAVHADEEPSSKASLAWQPEPLFTPRDASAAVPKRFDTEGLSGNSPAPKSAEKAEGFDDMPADATAGVPDEPLS